MGGETLYISSTQLFYLVHSNRGFIMYKYPLTFNMALMRFVRFSLILLIEQSVNYTDHGSLISLHASNPLIQVQPSRPFIF